VFNTSMISVGDVELRLQRWPGGAPPILALHGFTGAGSDFAPLARRLPNAVWAPDLLGHGGSRVPDHAQAWGFEAQAALLAQLPRTLDLDRPVLLGYSFGGRLALQLLVEQPRAFRAAVLVGATAGIEDPRARAERAAADRALADRIETIGAPEFLQEWRRVPLIATQERIAAADRVVMDEARVEHTAAGLAGALRGAGTGAMEPLWGRLGQVDLPVLLLTGAEDSKFAALAERLAQALPQATHRVVPGAGHCAHLEAPEAAVEAIEAFLGSL
jgi:2-succinyl-6-hydroxy-2,4-cyclohexadiene-1-carboxylate synthase